MTDTYQCNSDLCTNPAEFYVEASKSWIFNTEKICGCYCSDCKTVFIWNAGLKGFTVTCEMTVDEVRDIIFRGIQREDDEP